MSAKVARRGFLKLMGGAAVGGKQAAQAALEHTGIRTALGSGVKHGNSIGDPCSAQDSGDNLRRMIWQGWIANGFPEWKMDRLRREHFTVHGLDPDIASFRSFSLVNKVSMQRERQVQQAIDNIGRCWSPDDPENVFMKKHKIGWL